MKTLRVDAMPLVFYLCVLLLVFPPPGKVTSRWHREQQKTFRESRKVARKAMLDFKDFLTQVHRKTCRQTVPHSVHMFPVLASGVFRVPFLACHGAELSRRPKSQVWRVPPLSRSNFQLAITNCSLPKHQTQGSWHSEKYLD